MSILTPTTFKIFFMKNIRLCCHVVSFVASCFIVLSTIDAQEPIATNGKFSTAKGGLKMYYEESGKGTPLVLLHGFTGTSSMWKRFISEFAKFYRVINIDLPGHGRSDYMDTSDVYSHKKAAEYILALLHELKVDSAYVIGGSSGAIISLYMATIEPDLTKKIIVMAGQTYFSVQTRKIITSLGPGTQNPNMLASAIKTHGPIKAPILLRQFWNFRKLYEDPGFTPDVLSTIKAGALIIHGDNDPIAPVANALEMHQHIPNAYLWVVPNGRHEFIFDPANHADLQRRVLEFLRGDWDKN
jgi:pimeloyl-ACP methyl ester carboxylesterase